MKTMKLFSMAALCATSITPFTLIAPAMAQSASTSATMANTCAADLAAAVNTAATLHDGTPVWSTAVEVASSLDGAPTEVPGSRVETPGTRIGTGTATYSNLSISGDPFRTGGSVNMFGDQVAALKHWSNSEYDYTAQYATVTTFAYNCKVTQQTEIYHPAVPGQPVQGYYINCDFGQGQGNDNGGTCEDVGQPQGSCAAHNAIGPSFPHWGQNTNQCKFIKTADAIDPQPEYWETGDPVDRPDLGTSHTVEETNYSEGSGHETNGGPWTQSGNWFVAKVVICISPSKTVKGGVPGAWANHNGYAGTKCTTSWFNVAPWGGGSQTSNGTYISVPAV